MPSICRRRLSRAVAREDVEAPEEAGMPKIVEAPGEAGMPAGALAGAATRAPEASGAG